MDGHAAALEEETTTLRAAARTYDSAISSLQTEVTNRDVINCWQQKQLNERDERDIEQTAKAAGKIARLYVEKFQLLAAARPAVHTPPTNPPFPPGLATNSSAEPLAETTLGTPTPTLTLRTGTALISERNPWTYNHWVRKYVPKWA